jgi:hypothetical protein
MSAAEALMLAAVAGIRIRIDGDGLALEAATPPAADVLELLARYKTDIVTLLREGNGVWAGEDWREFFEERAGIAEFDGGLSRDRAAAQALSCCLHEFANRLCLLDGSTVHPNRGPLIPWRRTFAKAPACT